MASYQRIMESKNIDKSIKLTLTRFLKETANAQSAFPVCATRKAAGRIRPRAIHVDIIEKRCIKNVKPVWLMRTGVRDVRC